ncbi:hypothetical protein GCM10009092_30390 [Bowmanella denitrificans]|uniref:Curli production assembly/transport component CsgG n=1 Tax=Bowmanella denitrificans TaxID=366582 RepID=A0ABN0XGW8_9ALTE
MQFKLSSRTLMALAAGTLLSACMSTNPTMGGSSGNTVTGAAGGANAAGNNSQLESCDETLGTLSVFEDTNLTWWQDYRRRYPDLGSTIPVIRLMIQQSNCFVIVERGRAMDAMTRERELMQAGQLRGASNIGGGQMVAADYTLSPEIHFSAQGTEGIKAIGGALLGSFGAILGGGLSKNEASTTLLMIDNRSGVQVSASIGNAGNYDFNLLGGFIGGGLGGGASGFTNTPEGKIITAAFADSYNQMVKSLRNYRAQQVKGGLGKGGRLQVGGDDDATPQATNSASLPSKTQVTPAVYVESRSVTTVRKDRNYEFDVDEFDEDALKDYYRHLKNAATWASGLSAYTTANINDQTRNSVVAAMNIFSSQLQSSKIELESWPASAKQQAWNSLGSKIEQYNKLFEQHRDLALKNDALGDAVRSMLGSIQLITKESLLGI